MTGLHIFVLFLAFVTLLGAMGPRWRRRTSSREEPGFYADDMRHSWPDRL